ncbi:Toxin FitB [Botrimarina colliarenosi]|uniref:Ribonuclease VapC n=1 Tax=Botrimarina colliarenosi TaxID=2528001 RepID=A0A5C6A9G7_9BACT|nr:type II toxin-antitoxin system VapC family toxin [Botrimarina colliarenosi]TWT95958.1 Toxin FitB [Botrimarina colliarenosi]
MKYLIDTNVLSELTKPQPHPGVVAWLRRYESELVISSVVLGELRYGVYLLPAGRKRTRLAEWLAGGVERFPVLDFDAGSAEVWAQLLARLKRNGRAMPIKDSLVAAVAKQHGLTVATRNQSDFRNAGVKLVDPFASS